MSRYYLLGGFFLIGAAVLVLCQAIASMMTAGEIVWKRLRIVDIVGAADWLDGMPFQSVAQYIATMPLYVLLIAAGIFLFAVGGLLKK